MISNQNITANWVHVNEIVANLMTASGRAVGDIAVIAVSKTIDQTGIMAVYDAGQRLFGENKVQELLGKHTALPDDIQWHMIGHLQTNKVKSVLQTGCLIHSVDSVKVLRKMSGVATVIQRVQDFLFQVNVSGEVSKFGLAIDDVKAAMDTAMALPGVRCRGLMTMAPRLADDTALRRVFATLHAVREDLQRDYAIRLPELSMGMSADYAAAIKEGATLLRLGSAIFGPRR